MKKLASPQTLFSLFTALVVAGFLGPGMRSGAQSITDMAREVTAQLGAQGRLMWIDGSANVFHTVEVNGKPEREDYTTTPQGVAEIVRNCKAAHINTLIVDVKPLSGQVLYNSKLAPRMTSWKGKPVPPFDILAAFVQQGHAAGLQVDADINILSEGHKYYSVGPAYQHPDWQSVVYTVDRSLLAPDNSRLAARAPGEPDDERKPPILTDDTPLLGGEPVSGLVGLESTARLSAIVHSPPGAPPGKNLDIVLDADNRVDGLVDPALLGKLPMAAPADGHIVPLSAAADCDWARQRLKPGDLVRFDLKVARTPISQAPSEKVADFVNPLDPAVVKYELGMVREIVSNYDIDGLVLDRCRYSNRFNDFSDLSRNAFALWLHHGINRWPEDVFAFSPQPGQELIAGPLYKQWLEFRAETIRNFASQVAATARSIKPEITLGTYVGSWYPDYYEVGVNWGSEKTSLRYSWFTPTYPQTGYAEFFNWVSTGCYYPTATMDRARKEGIGAQATVEYAATLSNDAVADRAYVYAGIEATDYIGRPEDFIAALQAGARQSQGFMIFDLSYIDAYNWWPFLDSAFSSDAVPPSAIHGLLTSLRSAMESAN